MNETDITLFSRPKLVDQAIAQWTSQLIDLSGNNRLLYYRSLRVGTLELTTADPESVQRLIAGRTVRGSRFHSDPEARTDLAKRVRAIDKKAREADEERGVHTLYLAIGMASWTAQGISATPAAPILMRLLRFHRLFASASDFDLEPTDEYEVNPVLLHFLADEFGVSADSQDLLDKLGDDLTDGGAYQDVFSALTKISREVPGWSVSDGMIVGNFSYAKLPMVEDLQGAHEAVAANELLSAIAGDTEAKEALRQSGSPDDGDAVYQLPPHQDEFLVLDADSYQSAAIQAVVSGGHVVIIGPPGTDKSQTIANLIATLTAHGKSTLFVAEKQAAIDAVLKRLDQVGLGELVLDLHGGSPNRRQFAASLGAALEDARTAPLVDRNGPDRTLVRHRDQLQNYEKSLHEIREPWSISFAEARNRLFAPSARLDVRLSGSTLDDLTPQRRGELRDKIESFVELGGLRLRELPGEGWGAALSSGTLKESKETTEVIGALDDLLAIVPALKRLLAEVFEESGTRVPDSFADVTRLLELCDSTSHVLDAFQPEVFSDALPELVSAFAPAKGALIPRVLARLSSSGYRTASRDVDALSRRPTASPSEQYRELVNAKSIAEAWKEHRADDDVPVAADLPSLRDVVDRCGGFLSALESANVGGSLRGGSLDSLEEGLTELDRYAADAANMPDLHTIQDELQAAGLDDFLPAATAIKTENVGEVFEGVCYDSIQTSIGREDRALSGFDGERHRTSVAQFIERDRDHIAQASTRIKRAWAEGVVQARDAYPEQSQTVARQARLKRRHMPVRKLLASAPDVLRALKPCWMMSPLVVPQLIARDTPPFDVVVFDEASQVPPADAIPAILRGSHIAVAGDRHQLPPTSFFASSNDSDESAEEDEPQSEALTTDIESVLDVMDGLMPNAKRPLRWHYRSRDERLIALSNAQPFLYGGLIVTFPGALGDDCISHQLVTDPPGPDTASSTPEVERVVHLVLDHARERPHESLGVIALGRKHADRIEETLRLRIADVPDLEEFFTEETDEPFFVKNLERVQGDERDAIILSVGYGRRANGKPSLGWGPINQEGGERRLNVAFSRAKRRMTVVSSFSADELDRAALKAKKSHGPGMLCDILDFAASGGTHLGLLAPDKPDLNPFEIDVRDRLTDAGIPLEPQFGVSGYWIDFAAMHPERPGQPVLAIEADGASYHSSRTARDRDRLWQQHLENLGWRFHRIWSTAWFRDPETEVRRTKEAWDRAVEIADGDTPVLASQAQPAKAVPPFVATAQQRGPRPPIKLGRPIGDYTYPKLERVVKWVESDGQLRTADELLVDVMNELGFKRRGTKIVTAIERAIESARRTP